MRTIEVPEANSIGMPVIQNLRLPSGAVIEHNTLKASKQAMLTDIEIHLQHETLKIHNDFQQLLAELADYRFPEGSITQDSVMTLGFAVSNAQHAHARGSAGINRKLFSELNGGTVGPPQWWLDKQKITTDGPGFGLVRVVRDVSDPREISEYQADALTDELEAMLAQGWRVVDPASLDKLGLCVDAEGRLSDHPRSNSSARQRPARREAPTCRSLGHASGDRLRATRPSAPTASPLRQPVE